MIDILKAPRQCEVIGKVCIDLTDPKTGKVIERVEGKNHGFIDMIMAMEVNSSALCYSFLNPGYGISTAMMALNDDATAINPKFAFLRGNTIGYGTPGQGSSGLYRGAYNSANQVLADISDLTKARWKFQYEFTPSQANGTIRNVGLTQQYSYKSHISRHGITKGIDFKIGSGQYLNDARYSYTITATGIITKYDKYTKTQVDIDVSAVTGAVGSDYKSIGYAPRTGKYYVWKYSSTAGNRRMYVFSNNNFTTLETTYSPSNINYISGGQVWPMYIYGNFAYWCNGTNTLAKADFVNNVAHTIINIPSTIVNPNPSAVTTDTNIGSIADEVGMYLFGNITQFNRGVVWNPDNDTIAALFTTIYLSSTAAPLFNPLVKDFNWLSFYNPAYALSGQGQALTTYILPTPITKTSANGMTATYELEVVW